MTKEDSPAEPQSKDDPPKARQTRDHTPKAPQIKERPPKDRKTRADTPKTMKSTGNPSPKTTGGRPKTEASENAKCNLDHEASRSQYIVRFGSVAPSKIFKYDKSPGSGNSALNAAKRFAKVRCRELGLVLPPRAR